MKIAITGGAGFIGSRLTQTYLNAGHDVLVVDSLVSGTREAVDPRARFYHLDIRDARLYSVLQLERPDILSHHTIQRQGVPNEQALADADVHVRGLLNVLDSSVNAGVCKFIFASGGNSLYGNVASGQGPIAEDAPLHPGNAHDISNMAGEWYVRFYTQQYGLTHTILRYADVYDDSAGQRSRHPLNYFMSMLQEQRRPVIRGSGEEVRDHIHIDDVIKANLSVLKRGENRTFHISSGQGISLNRLYQLAAQTLESELEPIHLTAGSTSGAGATILSNRQAWHILGWQPEVALTEGLQKLRVHQEAQAQDKTPSTDELVAISMSKEATLSRA